MSDRANRCRFQAIKFSSYLLQSGVIWLKKFDCLDFKFERAGFFVTNQETELTYFSSDKRPSLWHLATTEYRCEIGEIQLDCLPVPSGVKLSTPGNTVKAAVLTETSLVCSAIAL